MERTGKTFISLAKESETAVGSQDAVDGDIRNGLHTSDPDMERGEQLSHIMNEKRKTGAFDVCSYVHSMH